MHEFIPSFIPAAFPALALAHFLALLSPGPDFFLIVGHAVRSRLPGAVYICAGIALGNAVYITLSIAGWSALKNSPLLYSIVEFVGAVYLLWMGVMLLRSSAKPFRLDTHTQAHPLSPLQQLAVGLGSAILNPKNAIFYLSLMTVILGPATTMGQQVFSGIWMVLLVFGWDITVAAIISFPKVQRQLSCKIPVVERMAGIVLLMLSVGVVVNMFF